MRCSRWLVVAVAAWTLVRPAESLAQPPDAPAGETDTASLEAGDLSLDFDLLDPPAAPSPALDPQAGADQAMRRTMLTVHQGVGLGLVALMTGAMISGQLNYNDKFLGGNTEQFALAHKSFAYPTVGLAAVGAGLALFAPRPQMEDKPGFDRVTLHKIGQFTALAGWGAQLALGLLTATSEGRLNQRAFATAHLAAGYVTLAGMAVGVGAITF